MSDRQREARNYRTRPRAHKEGRARNLRLVAACLVGALLLSGCVSAADCIDRIPEHLRADAIRMAIDKRLVRATEIPPPDYELARNYGMPLADMTRKRQDLLARHALGYAACVRERMRRRDR